jgi:hypothetical protein
MNTVILGPYTTGALYYSILHERREGLLAKSGKNDGSTHS